MIDIEIIDNWFKVNYRGWHGTLICNLKLATLLMEHPNFKISKPEHINYTIYNLGQLMIRSENVKYGTDTYPVEIYVNIFVNPYLDWTDKQCIVISDKKQTFIDCPEI